MVREAAHKSDSKLQSISTARLDPQHHLWYAPQTASRHAVSVVTLGRRSGGEGGRGWVERSPTDVVGRCKFTGGAFLFLGHIFS